MISFLEILDRAETGPFMDTEEWEIKFLPRLIKNKINEYKIQYDPETILPNDDVAQDVFNAGYELALEAGLFCASTERRILLTENEIKELFQNLPTQRITGRGDDEIIISPRTPSDKKPPVINGSPIGAPSTEEMYVPIVQSYIQEPIIDVFGSGPVFSEVQGRKIRIGTPTDILAAFKEVTLIQEAAKRAGRPDIGKNGISVSPSDIAHLATVHSSYGFYPTDTHLIPLLTELKTDYHQLNQVALAIKQQANINGYSIPLLGGYVGGPEGAAITMVAGNILSRAVHFANNLGHTIHDLHFGSSTSPKSLWAQSTATLGLTSQFPLLTGVGISPLAGPETTMLLQEVTAATIASTLAGVSQLAGVRSAKGEHVHHCSGLEARFMGELAHAVAAAELSRDDANVIIKGYINKYSQHSKNPDFGKPFMECYNIKSLVPSHQWQQYYESMKTELSDIGLEL